MVKNIVAVFMKRIKLKELKILNSLNKIKFELLVNFIAMTIAGIIGIMIGFRCEGYRQQRTRDRITNSKLAIMYLESEYNLSISRQMYKNYSNIKLTTFTPKILDDTAARVAFQDENMVNVLPNYQISLIRGYISGIITINYINDKYITYLKSVKFMHTSGGEVFRNSLKQDTAGFLALCGFLRKEFKRYFIKKEIELEMIRNYREKIRKMKDGILKGANIQNDR